MTWCLRVMLWIALVAMSPSAAFAQAETRIEGAALRAHPIAPLALRYVELVHAGRVDDAMKLASAEAQANYRKEPASERAAIGRFLAKMLPTRKELEATLATGGVLIVEGGKRATLNVVKSQQASTKPGSVTATATTVFMPFVMEGGTWKVAG